MFPPGSQMPLAISRSANSRTSGSGRPVNAATAAGTVVPMDSGESMTSPAWNVLVSLPSSRLLYPILSTSRFNLEERNRWHRSADRGRERPSPLGSARSGRDW